MPKINEHLTHEQAVKAVREVRAVIGERQPDEDECGYAKRFIAASRALGFWPAADVDHKPKRRIGFDLN